MDFRLLCAFLLVLPTLVTAVQINEIMYDPAASESYAEWVELYNNESTEINLTSWFLCDKEILPGYVNKSDGQTNYSTNLTLPPDTYAIITDGVSGSTVLNDFSVNTSAWLFHINGSEMCTNGLINSGETVTLNMSNGTIYDSVAYTDIASQDYSLERQSNGTFAESSILGGTPGSPNSAQQSEDLGTPDYGPYNITIDSFPDGMQFGSQSAVNVTFFGGNSNFSKIRLVAYAYTPAWISVDASGNTIKNSIASNDRAVELENVTSNKNITTNITLKLEDNCDGAHSIGNYTVNVRIYNFTNGTWNALDSKDQKFNISVSAKTNCPPPSSPPPPSGGSGGGSSPPPSPSISVDVIKYLRIGEDFEIEAFVFNSFATQKEVEIYSYIYRSDSGTEYANTGGPTANRKTITLKPNSKTSVKLTNTIKPEAEGDYTLKVRVKDGEKNYDGTEKIKIERSSEESEGEVSVNVTENERVEPAPSGLTGFFLGLGGNKTSGSNIGGAMVAGIGNFIADIINGFIKMISDVIGKIF